MYWQSSDEKRVAFHYLYQDLCNKQMLSLKFLTLSHTPINAMANAQGMLKLLIYMSHLRKNCYVIEVFAYFVISSLLSSSLFINNFIYLTFYFFVIFYFLKFHCQEHI